MADSIQFDRKILKEQDLPYSALEDKITGHGRWSVVHEIVFELGGKFYRTTYSIGATEMQDERPWQYEDSVTCEEVKRVEKVIQDWAPVDE